MIGQASQGGGKIGAGIARGAADQILALHDLYIAQGDGGAGGMAGIGIAVDKVAARVTQGLDNVVGDADGVVVLVTLKNAPAADQPAHIHPGPCANLTPAPKYPLTNVANGTSKTIVKGVTLQQLTSGTFAINVHKSTSAIGTYVSCGAIVKPATSM